MRAIETMTMPTDFRYREVFLRGKPQHEKTDAFRTRHPNMDTGRRAKIFSPFDALKGFSGAVEAKNIRYSAKRELNPEETAELSRRLTILKKLTYNSRMARCNRVPVTAICYVPCTDEESEAYGLAGRNTRISGICYEVDEVSKIILIDRNRISFENLLALETDGDIFKTGRAYLFPDD